MVDYYKQERNELARAGARAHPNSGRGRIKADGSTSDLVIDIKVAAKSFTLNEKVWSKVCTDAFKVDPYKSPALLVVLGAEGQPKKRLAIVEYDVLQALMEDE